MTAVNLRLKNYQAEALDRLRRYLRNVGTLGARAAFIVDTNLPFSEAPHLDPEMPYVCLRVPTGGGKTLMAAHTVGIAAREHLQAQNPMVLWLVPSTAILDQTLGALRDLQHPYRAALAKDFGTNVSVMSVREALALPRPDAEGGACIIVGTMQSFRVEDIEGRKVYEDAGSLMEHFSGLHSEQVAMLEKVNGTQRPVASLCNVLRLHRPMVIVDEAHNARTSLSFQTLDRLKPSLILEMTATPETTRDPDKGRFPSNVLYHVSAAELKAEEMIKLPVRLQTHQDWKQTVGQALDCQKALEEAADAERAETGERIRPIVLFQAQSASKNDPHRLVPDVVKQFLRDDKLIPENQIVIHGAGKSELDGVDIEAENCPVRYVITVQKLREGWDCPFAYVLCSVAELHSKTAVEQILGRVLRMPKARRKRRDVLNRAYAFVASSNFQEVAERLKDGLVEGAGFNRLEVEELVKPHAGLAFEEERADFMHVSDSLPEQPGATSVDIAEAVERLPVSLKQRVRFDAEKRTLAVTRALSRDDRNHLQLAFAKVPGAERVIERLFIRSNRIQATEHPEDEQKPPFVVPRLGIWRQGELELFQKDHFLDTPWNLAESDPSPVVDRFVIRDASKGGDIDVTEEGQMKISFAGLLHDQLAMAVQEPAWTLPRLVNWIDRGIPHPDVTKPAAQVFMRKALEEIIKRREYTLDELARYKYELRREIAAVIAELREQRETDCFGALFAANAEKFATSAEIGILFDEQSYAYNQPYRGSRKFNKHYFAIIGDLDPKGEEFACAVFLDEHPKVRYWVRNVPRKPNAFWLQLPNDKFYPDFVAMLTDGRIAVVEYKGAHLMANAETKNKRIVGELWAEASGGTCIFDMPTDRDFSALDQQISVATGVLN